MSNIWDKRFLDLARHIAQWSKDQSTKVGCVIVGTHREIRAVGYNGFPRGIEDEPADRHVKPTKYLWTEHAETNAIYQAARIGTPLEGCTMYLPWFPCMACARAIVQSGITRLVAVRPNLDDPNWGTDFKSSPLLLQEAGICIDYIDDPRTLGDQLPAD